LNKFLKIGLFVILLLFITTNSYAYRCPLAPKGGKYCALQSCYSCKWERQYEREKNCTTRSCKYPPSKEAKRSSLRGPDHSKGYVKNGIYYPNNMNQSIVRHGSGLGLVNVGTTQNGANIYDWVVDLPCFYSAPGDTPCDRGSMSKKRNGVGHSRNMKQMGPLRRVQPSRRNVTQWHKMENGYYVLPKE
jgi:hypothetical protein